jgi:hypothetical protein
MNGIYIGLAVVYTEKKAAERAETTLIWAQYVLDGRTKSSALLAVG